MRARSRTKRVFRAPDLRGSFVGMVTWKSLAQPSCQRKASCGLKLVTKHSTQRTRIAQRSHREKIGRSEKGKSGGAKNEPEKLGVEGDDGHSDDPGDDLGEARVGELAHLLAIAGELDKRNHRKWQLKAENHLAKDEQRRDFILAGDADHESGRNDGDAARDEPAQPRLEANVEKTLHDDLA